MFARQIFAAVLNHCAFLRTRPLILALFSTFQDLLIQEILALLIEGRRSTGAFDDVAVSINKMLDAVGIDKVMLLLVFVFGCGG